MLVTLGVLSLSQLIFVPGLILARLSKLTGFWEIILFSIGISPIFNYILVLILTLLGMYTQPVILIIFTLEIFAIIYLYYSVMNQPIKKLNIIQNIKIFFNDYLEINSNNNPVVRKVANLFSITFIFFALGAIFYYFGIYGTKISSSFTMWDAVVSWDRWAVDWFYNSFPKLTYHYPQLMPANYSITYQFMGNSEIKFFAKNFANFIEIFILLVVFISGIITRKAGYFAAVPIVAFFQFFLGSQGSGYADSPVAFWALLSITFLLLSQQKENGRKYIIIGAFFAAGSAVVKQAGFWIVINYFILVMLFHHTSGKKFLFSLLKKIFVIDFLVIFPWYLYKEIEILFSRDMSEIEYVTTLGSEGRTVLETVEFAVRHLLYNFKISPLVFSISLIIIASLIVLSYRDRFWRMILSLIVLPYIPIWVFFFTYDVRNLNVIIPLFGVILGIGIQSLLEAMREIDISPLLRSTFVTRLQRIFQKLGSVVISIKLIYLLLLGLVVFLLPLKYSDSYLLEKAYLKQKDIGYAELNQKIYDYKEEYGLRGKILTGYLLLKYLPELDQHYVMADRNNTDYIDKVQQDDVEYVLIGLDGLLPEVQEYYNKLINEKKIKVVFYYNQYTFFEKCNDVCD